MACGSLDYCPRWFQFQSQRNLATWCSWFAVKWEDCSKNCTQCDLASKWCMQLTHHKHQCVVWSLKLETDLRRGKLRRAEAATVRCTVQIKLHFGFVCWHKLCTDPHARCVHIAPISLYIHAWLLASTVHTSNRAEYMPTLRMYGVLPHFDELTVDGSSHAACSGWSCCVTSTNVHTCAAQVCSRLYK